RFAGFLVLGHLQNRVHGLLLGRIDKAAGIDDNDVCVPWFVRELVAAIGQLTHHHFRVYKILGTPKTDKADFQSGSLRARYETSEYHPAPGRLAVAPATNTARSARARLHISPDPPDHEYRVCASGSSGKCRPSSG